MMPRAVAPDDENLFERKLRRAASGIRRDAEGRTCGECVHAYIRGNTGGHCALQSNIDGGSLVILRASAPACRTGFTPRDS